MCALACSDDAETSAMPAEDAGMRESEPSTSHQQEGTDAGTDVEAGQEDDAGKAPSPPDGGLPDSQAEDLAAQDAGNDEVSDENAGDRETAMVPAPVPSGHLAVDELPTTGAVGFILAENEYYFYRAPDADSTSINHISHDGTRAFGSYSGEVVGDQGFEIQLDTNEYAPIVLEGTRFTIVRGGYGSRLVGKLAEDPGTPDDPDDDVRMGFIHDMDSGETLRFSRDGFDDIGFTSLNADGVITGFNDFGTRGFLFIDGDYIDLEDPTAYRLFPFQINDHGQFVGFWGTSEETWYDNSNNPSFVGHFEGESVASLETYEFPGYTGTGLAGINNAGVMAGIAYPDIDSLPRVFSTAAVDALPKVHPLPDHLEPFVTGIDDRGWVYGQVFIHDQSSPEQDPEAVAIAETVSLIRSYLEDISGPSHSGPLSGTIHSSFHDVENPIIELETAAENLIEAAADREANAGDIQATLADELWIEARKLDATLFEMQSLVEASDAAESPEAETVLEAIANMGTEVSVLRERIADMAEQFQEPLIAEFTGLGGPLNPKLLANGNVLVALAMDNQVVELSEDGAVVWSHTIGSPSEAQRLASGNTLIASTEEGRVIELSADDEIVWEYPGESIYGARRLDNGNTLITVQGDPAHIVEVDAAGEIVWQYGGGEPSLLAPSAQRLSNGNTLVADNSGYSLGVASVVELDTSGDMVWGFDQGIFGIYGVDRLESGSTLINDQANGRLLEVSESGQRLWSYGTLNLPGGFQVLPNDELLIAVFGENRIVRIAR